MKPFKIVLCLLWAGWITGCDSHFDAAGVVRTDFRLEDRAGQRFYLNQHRGRIVLLVFWSTGCTYCELELKALEALRQQMNQQQIVVAAILMDPENRSRAGYGSDAPTNGFPVLLDWGKKVSTQFRIFAVPTTVVLDQTGTLTFRRSGFSQAIMQEIQSHMTVLKDRLP